MKNKQKGALQPVALLSLLVLVGVGLYLYYAKGPGVVVGPVNNTQINIVSSKSEEKRVNEVVNTTITNPGDESSLATENNAKVNTYIDPSGKFQFEYPIGWNVKSIGYEGDGLIIEDSTKVNSLTVTPWSVNMTCVSNDWNKGPDGLYYRSLCGPGYPGYFNMKADSMKNRELLDTIIESYSNS